MTRPTGNSGNNRQQQTRVFLDEYAFVAVLPLLPPKKQPHVEILVRSGSDPFERLARVGVKRTGNTGNTGNTPVIATYSSRGYWQQPATTGNTDVLS